MILKYNIDNNIGGKNYEKEYFCIRNYLMTMLLAVGCSNNASQSNNNNEAKSTKTSHKKSHKAKKHTTKKDKTDIDTDNSETTNSDKKTDKRSSESSKSSTSEKASQNGSANSNASSNSNESKNTNNSNGSSILQHLILKIMAVKVLRQLIALQMLCLIRWFLILSKKMATQVAMAQTTLR